MHGFFKDLPKDFLIFASLKLYVFTRLDKCEYCYVLLPDMSFFYGKNSKVMFVITLLVASDYIQ